MSADARRAGASGAPAEAPPPVSQAPADAVPASRHVPHIDGLRAIAVLAVIAYHLDESWLPGGFAGVDVFFAISGFVVAASVHAWNRGGFAAFLGYFYARRMQRIAPALVACLLLTSLASTLFIPAAWLSNANERTGLYAFFGLSNWFLANHRENYFSPTTEFNPYTHTWSLGVEEQFYLLFPLLFFAWTRGGRWRGVSLALFALALAGSLAWAFRLARLDPTAGFYLIQSRLWELASGVLLYQLLVRFARTGAPPHCGRGRLASAGAWIALALLATGLVVSTPGSFPWPGALLPVLGTLGLIGFLHARPPGLLAGVLGSRPMTAIGRMSYSLYLWHWPVFVLLRWTSGLDSANTRFAGVAATFGFAAVSYLWVERPLRYSPMLRRWPRPAVVAAGLLAIVSGWWLATQFTDARRTVALTTVSRNADDWYPQFVRSLPDLAGCRMQSRPAMAGSGSLAVMTRTGCSMPQRAQPTIFVIGDSHANGYMTLLSEHVLRTGASVVLYHNSGCTFASLQPQREGGRCGAQGKAALDDILAPRRNRRLRVSRCAAADASEQPVREGRRSRCVEKHDRQRLARGPPESRTRHTGHVAATRGAWPAHRAGSAQAFAARAPRFDVPTGSTPRTRSANPDSRLRAKRSNATASRCSTASRAWPHACLRSACGTRCRRCARRRSACLRWTGDRCSSTATI